MASGRIGSASGLNVFIDWTSTENSITANLYLYNQYRISTSVNKSWSLTINGNTKQGTIYLGDKSAGTTTLIGSHTISSLTPNSSYSISGVLNINLNSYNGSAVSLLSASGTGNTDVGKGVLQINNVTTTLNTATVNYSHISGLFVHVQYSLNGGTWQGALGYPNMTISDLAPNTSYTIRVRALNNDRTIIGDASNSVSFKTLDIARISNLSNFEHGSNPTLVITNPASISSLNLVMKIGDTQILSRIVSTGNNTITLSNTELDNLYKKYGSSNSVTATFVLSGSGYTNNKICTVTLKGNQKTMRTNVSGSWKRGKLWTNVNGTWKRGVLWTNVNGTWKRGI